MIESGRDNPVWARSTLCANNSCVEVALVEQHVLVRDSKIDGGPTLQFDRDEWISFIHGVRQGQFDLP